MSNSQGAVKPRSEGTAQKPSSSGHSIEAGGVHIPTPQFDDSVSQPEVRYLAGTTKDCPVQNIHVRGVAFQRFTGGTPQFSETGIKGKPRHVNDARDVGAARWGGYVLLTKAQLDQVCEDVGKKMLRVTQFSEDGSPLRGEVRSTVAASYKHGRNDYPLGRYLYLHRADKLSGEHMESGLFPPMIKD